MFKGKNVNLLCLIGFLILFPLSSPLAIQDVSSVEGKVSFQKDDVIQEFTIPRSSGGVLDFTSQLTLSQGVYIINETYRLTFGPLEEKLSFKWDYEVKSKTSTTASFHVSGGMAPSEWMKTSTVVALTPLPDGIQSVAKANIGGIKIEELKTPLELPKDFEVIIGITADIAGDIEFIKEGNVKKVSLPKFEKNHQFDYDEIIKLEDGLYTIKENHSLTVRPTSDVPLFYISDVPYQMTFEWEYQSYLSEVKRVMGKASLSDVSLIVSGDLTGEMNSPQPIITPQESPAIKITTVRDIPKDSKLEAKIEFSAVWSKTSSITGMGATPILLEIISPEGALDGIVSTNQAFEVQAILPSGQVPSDSGDFLLAKPPQYRFVDISETELKPFKTGEPVIWRILSPKEATPTSKLKVALVGREEMQGEVSVTTVGRGTLSNQLNIVSPRGARDGIVSTGQDFTLQVIVLKAGTADVLSRKAKLNALPAEYELTEYAIEQTVPANGIVTWKIQATAPVESQMLSVTSYGVDENSGEEVESEEAFLEVTSVAAANLRLSALDIISPPGAIDQTVSTGQRFTVRTKVFNDGVAKVEGKGELTLVLSEGYQEDSNELTKPFAISEGIQWDIEAPDTTSKEGLIKVLIKTIPSDENTNLQVKVSSAVVELPVTTVQSATISVNEPAIVSPSGAVDGIVSTGQTFTVAVRIDNQGQAHIDKSGRLTLKLPEGGGYTLVSSATLPVEQIDQPFLWTLTVPPAADEDSSPFSIDFTTSPNDENTNEPALLVKESVSFSVTTVKGAEVELQIVEPDAKKLQASVRQPFNVTAKILNHGQANYLGNGTLELEFDTTLFALETGNKEAHFSQQEDTVSWYLQPKSVTSGNIIVKIVDIPNDENTNQPVKVTRTSETLFVEAHQPYLTIEKFEITSPQGAIDGILSDGQQFKMHATISASLYAEIKSASLLLPEGYKIPDEANIQTPTEEALIIQPDGSEKWTAVWTITAPESKKEQSPISIEVVGEDKLAGQAITNITTHFLVETVSASSLRLGEATIVSPDGATDGIISTDQSFTIGVEVHNQGDAGIDKEGRLTLKLPEGYTLVNSPTLPVEQVDQLMLWTVTSPSIPDVSSAISIHFTTPPNDENTNKPATIIKDSASLPITTVKAAELELQIFEPASKKQTVSTRQPFRITAKVMNNGQAALVGQGALRLEFDTNSFALEKGNIEELFSQEEATVTWRLIPKAITSGNIIAKIINLPKDENTNKPVKITKASETLFVEALQPYLKISTYEISSPQGAKDGIVSTEQTFTIYATIVASKNAKITNASLSLPEGYEVSAGTQVQSPSAATLIKLEDESSSWVVGWNIRVPMNPKVREPIIIEVKGEDQLATTPILPVAAEAFVQTIRAATLSLEAEIIHPDGAKDSTVSTEQTFTLRATVTNEGDAGIDEAGQIAIILPDGYNVTGEKTLSFTAATPVTWMITAPPYPSPESNIQIFFNQVPNDANTNSEAKVTSSKPLLIPITTVSALTLSVTLEITSPEGALDGILSTGQNFQLQATITASGAGKADDLKTKLFLPVGYKIVEATETPLNKEEKAVSKILNRWTIRAPQAPDDSLKEVRVNVSGLDGNSGLLKEVQGSRGIQTVSAARLSIESINLSPVGSQNSRPDAEKANINHPIKVSVTIKNTGHAQASGILPMKDDLDIRRDSVSVRKEYEITVLPMDILNGKLSGGASAKVNYLLTPNATQQAGVITIKLVGGAPVAKDENSGADASPIASLESARLNIQNPAQIVIESIKLAGPLTRSAKRGQAIVTISNQGQANARVFPSGLDLLITRADNIDLTSFFKIEPASLSTITLSENETKEIVYLFEPTADFTQIRNDGDEFIINTAGGRPRAEDQNEQAEIKSQFYTSASSALGFIDIVPPVIESAIVNAEAIVLTLTFSEPIKTTRSYESGGSGFSLLTLQSFTLLVAGDSFGEGASVRITSERTVEITLGKSAVLQSIEQFDKGNLSAGSPSGVDVSITTAIEDTASNQAAIVGGVDIDFEDKEPPVIRNISPTPSESVNSRPKISAWVGDVQGRFNSGIDSRKISVTLIRNGKPISMLVNFEESEPQGASDFIRNNLKAEFPPNELDLTEGEYSFVISVVDQRGNKKEKKSSLRVGVGVITDFLSYPNPFNPKKSYNLPQGSAAVVFLYTLNSASYPRIFVNSATLNIYDVSGQLIYSQNDLSTSPGRWKLLWDGKTTFGSMLPAGAYICELVVETTAEEDRKYWKMAVGYW